MSASQITRDGAPSNRLICTLALLEVHYNGNGRFVDCFVPFVCHCLAKVGDARVSVQEVQAMVEEIFGIGIPQSPLTTILRRVETAGRVEEVADGLYRPIPERLVNCHLDAARAAAHREHRALVGALRSFAHVRCDVKWTDAEATKALTAYIDSYSAGVLAAAIEGRAIEQPAKSLSPPYDVVHQFVAFALSEDPNRFTYLQRVVKGQMLSDALFYTDFGRKPVPMKGLEVYLDGPILMDVLGLAGKQLQAPALELLQMLAAQGAHVRCFEHSVAEVQEVIRIAADKHGQPLVRRAHRDVVGHLANEGASRGALVTRAKKVPTQLLRLGITPVRVPAPRPSLAGAEARIEKLLDSEIRYQRDATRVRDLESMIGIHRVRDGRQAAEVAKSRAIFLTDNDRLFRVGVRFSEGTRVGPAVPICLLARPFTTFVWLQQPVDAPDLPRECLIADALAAFDEPDEKWTATAEEIGRLRADETISDDNLAFMRAAREEDDVLTNADFDRESDWDSRADVERRIRQKERERLEALLEDEARSRERSLEEQERLEDQLGRERQSSQRSLEEVERVRLRVGQIGNRLARSIAQGALAVLGTLFLFGTLLATLGPLVEIPVPTTLRVAGGVVLAAVTIASGLAGASIRSTAHCWEQRLGRRIERLLLRVLRIDDPDQHR